MDNVRIFYSWQSDDDATSDFVFHLLKDAISKLQLRLNPGVEVILDKDTHNVSGSPDITNTILDKINRANIVVSDISCIGSCNCKKVVNQNVMFETGYAIAKHSTDSVIMLFNKDQGSMRDLPFDISHNRVTGFSVKNDDCEYLASMLADMIKSMLKNPHATSLEIDAEQEEILRIFSSIKRDKCLILSNIFAFGTMIWARSSYDKDSKVRLIKRIGTQEFIANLNDLVEKGILRKTVDGQSAMFEPTKVGFNLIRSISSNQSFLTNRETRLKKSRY